jgi:hypothetical protein
VWCAFPNGDVEQGAELEQHGEHPYDEDGVFIHPNGRTLYFSSQGHNSMGGFDIFYTEQQDDGTGQHREPRATH